MTIPTNIVNGQIWGRRELCLPWWHKHHILRAVGAYNATQRHRLPCWSFTSQAFRSLPRRSIHSTNTSIIHQRHHGVDLSRRATVTTLSGYRQPATNLINGIDVGSDIRLRAYTGAVASLKIVPSMSTASRGGDVWTSPLAGARGRRIWGPLMARYTPESRPDLAGVFHAPDTSSTWLPTIHPPTS
jgi:hypothetical protein